MSEFTITGRLVRPYHPPMQDLPRPANERAIGERVRECECPEQVIKCAHFEDRCAHFEDRYVVVHYNPGEVRRAVLVCLGLGQPIFELAFHSHKDGHTIKYRWGVFQLGGLGVPAPFDDLISTSEADALEQAQTAFDKECELLRSQF